MSLVLNELSAGSGLSNSKVWNKGSRKWEAGRKNPCSLSQSCRYQLQGQDLLGFPSPRSHDFPKHPSPKEKQPKQSTCFATFSCRCPLIWCLATASPFSPRLLNFATTLLTMYPSFEPLFSTSYPSSHTTYFLPIFSTITIKENTKSTCHRPAKSSWCILDSPFLPGSGFPAPRCDTRCSIPSTAVSRMGLQPR